MRAHANGSGVCLDPPEQQRLKSLIERIGERELAEEAAMSRTTLARAAAGLPLRRASATVLRQVLAAAHDGNEAP
jgi:hypothetical protein